MTSENSMQRPPPRCRRAYLGAVCLPSTILDERGRRPAVAGLRHGVGQESVPRRRTHHAREEIGMRTFQIKRARAVERATDRMRQGLKDDWAKFSEPEVEALQWALGEVWAYVAHAEWDDLHFG